MPMEFKVSEAEYIGLLRIKAVTEAVLRSRDHWVSEVGYAKMFELIQGEIEAYYTATGQPVPDFYLKTLNERYDGVKFSIPVKEQEK